MIAQEIALHCLTYWAFAGAVDRQAPPIDVVFRVLFNQIVVTGAMLWLASDAFANEVDLLHVLRTLPLVLLVEELAFYWAHRALHAQPLYALIHSRHHRWVETVSWCALDCHPVEHVLANFGPVLAGPLLAGWSLPWMRAWSLVATLNTVWAHRSKAVSPESRAHAVHHARFNVNFGVSPVADWCFGTLAAE